MKIIKKSLDVTISSLAQGIVPLRKRQLILCYHRLSNGGGNHGCLYNPVSTTPAEAFDEQMRWLSRFCEFKSLEDIYAEGDASAGWQVAVTFDDGYRDNLELGLPILSKYQIPVTLFATTAYNHDPRRLPWWDLCNYLRNAPNLVGLKEALNDSSNDTDRCVQPQGEALSYWLCKELTRLNTKGPYSEACTFNHLVNKALCRIDPALENDMLRPDDLARLAQSPLVSVGMHTDSHPSLSLLSKKEQKAEFERSIQHFEQWRIKTANWFAYPFGKSRNYTESTREILAELGITAAVTTYSGYLGDHKERYDLPRFSVDGRWTLDTFKARILTGPVIEGVRKKLKFKVSPGVREGGLQPDGQ